MLSVSMEETPALRAARMPPRPTGLPFRRAWTAVPQNVADVRRTVVEQVRRFGATPAALAAVELAVSEAMTNAVQHAYVEAGEPGPVTVTVEHEEACVLVSVQDEGGGMRPRPDSPGLGLGLPLISQMTQSFEVHQPPGGGTLLCMRFDAQRGQL